MKRLLFNGMDEVKLPGMECLSSDQAVVRIVEKIAGQRMADMLHVDPDLMGSSGLQAKLH